MQMIRIRFPDAPSRTRGFYELMQQVRVVCLPGDEFVIPGAGLAILEERNIPYHILEQSGWDHALKALRVSAAAPI